MNKESLRYDPPYTPEEIRRHYDKHTYEMLMNDPVHRWRAETGIELIHKEPTLDEFTRICKNWKLMDDEMKKQSDEQSIRIFGMTNEEHIPVILRQYAEESLIDYWASLV